MTFISGSFLPFEYPDHLQDTPYPDPDHHYSDDRQRQRHPPVCILLKTFSATHSSVKVQSTLKTLMF